MVGAERVKGGWSRNELGEVIQNEAEKRKSRDQGREDIIKSLIRIMMSDWWYFFYKNSKINTL